ncbi:hypothetical protein EJB05_28826, partial [Eragrostis curvula]
MILPRDLAFIFFEQCDNLMLWYFPVMSKKLRQPVVISQRRRTTEKEMAHALKREKEFKSKNPFTLQVMLSSYVYVGFFMVIISHVNFSEYLPHTEKKMTLWDPQGKPWQVHDGWGKFAVGKNLEKFDVCVFELLKEDNIKVHIYRVVPQITPLHPQSGHIFAGVENISAWHTSAM